MEITINYNGLTQHKEEEYTFLDENGKMLYTSENRSNTNDYICMNIDRGTGVISLLMFHSYSIQDKILVKRIIQKIVEMKEILNIEDYSLTGSGSHIYYEEYGSYYL